MVSNGFSEAYAWRMTPRQLKAYTDIIQREEARRASINVRLLRAAKGSNKSFKEFVARLDKQAD